MKVVTDAGETIYLGRTEIAPTIGIVDYGVRKTDDFGVTTVVERGFSRTMSVKLALPFDQVDDRQRRLAALRATPARYVADDRYASLSVRGFFKEFEFDLNVPPVSYCTLSVEGLVGSDAVADSGSDPAPTGSTSTLRLLQPAIVTDAALKANSVPETDAAEWSQATSYAKGATVIRVATHRLYQSLVDANLGNDPAGTSGKWLDLGPTNRWAMFDAALGTATTARGTIVVTLDVGTIDGVALLDVAASTVRVQVGSYDRTQAVGAGAMTFLDLAGRSGQVTITISGSGQAAVGTLLVGRIATLGITEASPSAGITDYSRKTVDAFGAVTIVERAFAKRMSAKALIRTDAVDVVANRIAAVRARPSLWIGRAGTDSITVYGFFKDFSIEVGENTSKLSLSIEGLSKAAPAGRDPVKDLAAEVGLLREDIASVRVIATGRNRTFLQSSAPAAGESAEGDLWYDRSNNNALYRRGAGSGILAFAGSALAVGGNHILVAPWLPASDLRIDAARAEAAAAQARLAAILSDSILSVDEKRQFARDWQAAQASYSALDGKAASFGNVASLRSALTAAYNTLAAAIAAITPAYNDYTVDSPVDRQTVETRWANFYTAYAALDVAITAQTLVVQWSVASNGPWHPGDPVTGDKWQRQSVDGGLTFSAAQKVVGEDGGSGAAGLNNTTVFLFRRATAAPAVPTATLTYTFATAALAGDLAGWSVTAPAGTDPLYVTAATASSNTATDTIAGGEWAAPVIQARDGAAGATGYSQATIYLYQRAAAAPAVPSQPLTYTFASANLTGTIDNGWSTSIPAGANPLYVTVAFAYANTATDTVASNEWSAPVVQARDGNAGSAGLNVSPVLLYQRAGSAPAAPTADTTFTFATAVLSGAVGAWSQTVPAGLAPLWITTATASSNTATDTIATGEWASPRQIAVNGVNVATVTLYQRANAAPAVPTATLTYTFATSGLAGSLSGWALAVPDGTADLYVTQATALGVDAAATDTISSGEWSAPVIQARTGQRTSFVFQRAATQPATPTATTTPPPGWSDGPPLQTDPPLALWQSQADFRDTTKLTAWSTPIKLTPASLADLDPVAAAILAGKGRVFRQASAPLASVSQENDLWFDTANGDAAYSRGAGSGSLAVGGNRITIGGSGFLVAPWLPVSNPLAVKAAADAASAIAAANAAASDSILTPTEKADLAQQRAQVAAERDGLVAKATAQGLSPTTYTTAYTALIGFLDTLNLGDRSSNTGVDPTTLNDRLTAYYTARTALVSATGDLTAANQVAVQVTQAFTVNADYQGAVTSGLPLSIVPKVARGPSDIRTSADVSYAIATTNCTGSVDNTAGSATKGYVTVTAASANTATVDLTVTAGGVSQPAIRITITKKRADPPATGSPSSKSAVDETFNPVTTTSYAAISDVLTVNLAAGERLVGTAPLDYTVDGTSAANRTVSAKWQYRTQGAAAWSDFGSPIAGSVTTAGYEPVQGHGDFNQAVSGLSAATYETQLVAAASASGRGISFSGTALIEAKP